MIAYRIVSAEPKPGHEMQYYLAMKHRDIASRLEVKLQKDWRVRLFRPSALYRAYKLWSHAMHRVHQHGQDQIVTLGPHGFAH